MKYLTIEQYKASDEGVSLANVSDMSLARYISKAESDIDSWMEFDMMNGGFEPHTIWLQVPFDERSRRTPTPNGPVPARSVVRYRIQVSNISTSGAGFFADISPDDCAINVMQNYVEIVPLQSITYSLTPVLVQLGLRPPLVQMDTEIGWYLASFGEPLYPTGTPGVYVALRGFWAQTYNQSLASQPATLPPTPPVIYANGTVQDASIYSINWTEGQVTFNTPPQNSPTITADFTYQIPDNVRDATIAQVTYLLGLRALNQQGMQGLAQIRNGDVEIRTSDSFPARFPTDTGALCDRAAKKLANYKPIPIG